MSVMALDTLKVSKRLRDAGLSEAQAESETDAMRAGVAGEDLVTKTDLAALRSELKTDMAEFKAEMIKWMFGAMLAQGALVVTLIKLLPGK